MLAKPKREATSNPSHYDDKELAKLAARKRDAENKLAATRAEFATLKGKENETSVSINNGIDSRNGGVGPATSAITNNSNTTRNTSPGRQKRVASLTRDEIKLVSQIRKLEAQEHKVVSKIEAKQRRDAGKDEKMKAKMEIDGLKKEVQRLKSEIDGMRGERQGWLELVGRLQRENTNLAVERDQAMGIERDNDA
jgi:chromosome segregation ATPase